jgi:hypothetical protein
LVGILLGQGPHEAVFRAWFLAAALLRATVVRLAVPSDKTDGLAKLWITDTSE